MIYCNILRHTLCIIPWCNLLWCIILWHILWWYIHQWTHQCGMHTGESIVVMAFHDDKCHEVWFTCLCKPHMQLSHLEVYPNTNLTYWCIMHAHTGATVHTNIQKCSMMVMHDNAHYGWWNICPSTSWSKYCTCVYILVQRHMIMYLWGSITYWHMPCGMQ